MNNFVQFEINGRKKKKKVEREGWHEVEVENGQGGMREMKTSEIRSLARQLIVFMPFGNGENAEPNKWMESTTPYTIMSSFPVSFLSFRLLLFALREKKA